MIFKVLETFREACLSRNVHAVKLKQKDAHLGFGPGWKGTRSIDFSDIAIEALIPSPETDSDSDKQRYADGELVVSPGLKSEVMDLEEFEPVIHALAPITHDFAVWCCKQGRQLGFPPNHDATECTLFVDDLRLLIKHNFSRESLDGVKTSRGTVALWQERSLSTLMWEVIDHRFDTLLAMRNDPLFDLNLKLQSGGVPKSFAAIDTEQDYVTKVRGGDMSRALLCEAYALWDQAACDKSGYKSLNTSQQWLVHAAAIHAKDLTEQDAERLMSAGVYSLAANTYITLNEKQIYRLFITDVNKRTPRHTEIAKLPLNLHKLINGTIVEQTKDELFAQHRMVGVWMVGHVERLANSILASAKATSEQKLGAMGDKFRRCVQRMCDQTEAARGRHIPHDYKPITEALVRIMDNVDEQLIRSVIAPQPLQDRVAATGMSAKDVL